MVRYDWWVKGVTITYNIVQKGLRDHLEVVQLDNLTKPAQEIHDPVNTSTNKAKILRYNNMGDV